MIQVAKRILAIDFTTQTAPFVTFYVGAASQQRRSWKHPSGVLDVSSLQLIVQGSRMVNFKASLACGVLQTGPSSRIAIRLSESASQATSQ